MSSLFGRRRTLYHLALPGCSQHESHHCPVLLVHRLAQYLGNCYTYRIHSISLSALKKGMRVDSRDGGSRKVVDWSIVPIRSGGPDRLRINETIDPNLPSRVVGTIYFYRSQKTMCICNCEEVTRREDERHKMKHFYVHEIMLRGLWRIPKYFGE